jgi:hypothetical protein
MKTPYMAEVEVVLKIIPWKDILEITEAPGLRRQGLGKASLPIRN